MNNEHLYGCSNARKSSGKTCALGPAQNYCSRPCVFFWNEICSICLQSFQLSGKLCCRLACIGNHCFQWWAMRERSLQPSPMHQNSRLCRQDSSCASICTESWDH